MPNEGLDDEVAVFDVRGDQLVVNGVIDQRSLEGFGAAIKANPGIATLVLNAVPGSADDEANLQLARIVRDLRLETVVPSGGLVASGGTDLFLAGAERRIEPDACIGVHSWASAEGPGTDFPQDAPAHDPYLDYYEAIGIDPAFYWFTLDAAPADGMHWMTAEERLRFAMATEAHTDEVPDPSECAAR
jgi:hypothetical protein